MVAVADFFVLLMLLQQRKVAMKAPAQSWPAVALKQSQRLHARYPKHLAPFSARIPRQIEQLTGLTREDLSVRLFASYFLETQEIVAAALGKPVPWRLRLEGDSRLQEALAQGHGAVLWCEASFSSSLLIKAALATAGFPAHQLSRPGHNFSNTRFGIRYLNGVTRKAEGRYLAERIIVDQGSEMAASRRIMELLRGNRIVTVTVSRLGSQAVEAPVLDGAIRVATGAPHFALRSGAPLLPVFAYRDGEDYVVQIGERIGLPESKREDAYQLAVNDLAARVNAFVQAHPMDWSGWLRGGSYIAKDGEPKDGEA